MSRVGKNPVPVPAGVDVRVDGRAVKVKGRLGELAMAIHQDVTVAVADGKVTVTPKVDTRRARMMWGTTRANIRNMVQGVSAGFTQDLAIEGVGYRAAVQGKELVLQLGFSHDVKYPIPPGVTMKCDKPTSISISGADRQQIGQIAAEIRAYRPPEPYKGKGVAYVGEKILRKEGKKK